jgi:hypothetical protein
VCDRALADTSAPFAELNLFECRKRLAVGIVAGSRVRIDNPVEAPIDSGDIGILIEHQKGRNGSVTSQNRNDSQLSPTPFVVQTPPEGIKTSHAQRARLYYEERANAGVNRHT